MKRTKRKRPNNNRGGTKKEFDNIIFKSLLEIYCYKQLKVNNLEANYETETYEMLPSFIFNYNDKKTKRVLSMKYTPDFVGKDFIIECKGYANESFAVKWKVFKHYLNNNKIKKYLYKPGTEAEVDKVIKEILKKREETCL